MATGQPSDIGASGRNKQISKLKPKVPGTEGNFGQRNTKLSSFRASDGTTDPFAAEIWQMVAEPKVEEQTEVSPPSPSEVLGKGNSQLKKKLGAIVHSTRGVQEKLFPVKFVSVENLASGLNGTQPNWKLPLVSPKKQQARDGVGTKDNPDTSVPDDKSKQDKPEFRAFSRKTSMPNKSSGKLENQGSNTSRGLISGAIANFTPSKGNNLQAEYYHPMAASTPRGKQVLIKEGKNTESYFFRSTRNDSSAAVWSSSKEIRVGSLAPKTSVSMTKQNTHSQSQAIKQLLSKDATKVGGLSTKDVSFLLSPTPKGEHIGQRIAEVLGEKLSRELRSDRELPRVGSGTDWTPAMQGGALEASFQNTPASQFLPMNLLQATTISAAEISFGDRSKLEVFQSTDSTKQHADGEVEWSPCSPLSESEVASLANHTTDFYSLSCKFSHMSVTSEPLLYSLHKSIPNLLQNVPSTRHEAVELRNWYFRQLGTVKSCESGEAVCRLAVLESLRQFYVSNGQRTLLLMVALEELLGSYHKRYTAKKKQLDDHQTYFYDTLGSKAASFDEETAKQQKLTADLREQVNSLTKELASAKERLAEKHLIELK